MLFPFLPWLASSVSCQSLGLFGVAAKDGLEFPLATPQGQKLFLKMAAKDYVEQYLVEGEASEDDAPPARQTVPAGLLARGRVFCCQSGFS